ncbi:hypothetical protein CWI75_07205 [Kineobactrum sediminis]|uniref:Uncharacterized protein n=1 Tax=Kineobactrum sediminis TaxID=1905677 RepID=A0A2N5Y477_9GAMM|nr:hypothetical protein CWI75_07205 [Kineobactrum sediminis]
MNDTEQPLFAEALLVSGDSRSLLTTLPLLIEDDEFDGPGLRMQLPLNPASIYDEFEYQLVLVAGDQRCSAGTVSVTGLTPSIEPDATLAALELVLENLLIEYGVSFGLTSWGQLETAVKEFGTNPEPQVRLASILMAVEAQQGLQRQLEDLTAEERETVAAIIEQLDLIGILQLRAETVVTGLSMFIPRDDGGHKLVRQPMQVPWDGDRLTPLNGGVCTLLPGDKVDITSAADLDKYMRAQADASNSGDSDWRPVLSVLTPLIRGGSGNVAGIVLLVENLVTGFDTYQLPNRFTSMSFDVNPGQRILEDDNTSNKNWQTAVVGASSDEWNLDKNIIDAIGTGISASRWVGSLDEEALSPLLQTASNYLDFTILETLKSQVGDEGCFIVAANSWSGIDITGEQYTKPEVFGESIRLEEDVLFGPTGQVTQKIKIILLDKGISELRVSIRNAGGQFGGKTTARLQLVEVAPIRLTFTPLIYRAETQGDVVVMTLSVTDSQQAATRVPDIAFLSDGASLLFPPEVLSTGENSAVYQLEVLTPVATQSYPVIVEASRVSPLPPAEKRIDRGEIILEETITLLPSQACIILGETLDLTAELDGFNPGTNVEWSVESPAQLGNFQMSGDVRAAQFSSGQTGAFLVQVTASSVVKPGTEIIDTALISVGNCEKVHVWGVHQARASAGAGTSEESYDSVELERLEQAPFPPAQHNLFWSSRTEQLVETLTGTGEKNGQPATASIFTEATLSADADGVVTVRHRVPDIGSECIAPGAESVDQTISCTDAYSYLGGVAVFYLDIDAPKTYQLDIAGSCDLTGEAVGGMALTAYALRLPAGSTTELEHTLPNGPYNVAYDEVSEEDLAATENFLNPFLLQTATTAGNICGSGAGGVWSETVQFSFDGPVVPGTTDLITVTVGVGSTVLMDLSSVNLTDSFFLTDVPNISGGIGFVPNPLSFPVSLEAQGTGKFIGSMDTQMRIELNQVD